MFLPIVRREEEHHMHTQTSAILGLDAHNPKGFGSTLCFVHMFAVAQTLLIFMSHAFHGPFPIHVLVVDVISPPFYLPFSVAGNRFPNAASLTDLDPFVAQSALRDVGVPTWGREYQFLIEFTKSHGAKSTPLNTFKTLLGESLRGNTIGATGPRASERQTCL